ncbi:hypothetical protein Poly30_39730 [Planctomycetes bacterium Poly30]|uniref:Uncharacterized protein n=1 Tax=Saltatorellus ferox TaxID=2528018 RepID=A0A518EWI2_9BACT|nr:hypothetical protein Poly30_39730 [Planctomycetes bacterium Poly30]
MKAAGLPTRPDMLYPHLTFALALGMTGSSVP